jgi:hypothetical protein
MMNPRILLVLSLATTLATGVVFGAGGKLPPKKEYVPEHTTITSISADSLTISSGGTAKTYKLTKDTVLTFKGQTAKPEDLKAGMRVSVTMASDPTVASRVNASDPPKEESKDDKAKADDKGKTGGDKGKAGGNKKK